MDIFESDDNCIFPLTDNLGTSFVDTSKLICEDDSSNSQYPIGMGNFKSKKNQLTTAIALSSGARKFCGSGASCPNRARDRWNMAFRRVKSICDPWSEFNLDLYPTETAIRHRYDASKKIWTQDECTVKIETKKFEQGAMRACFRLKKLSNFIHKDNWQHASNYVAKSYIDPEIPRERYFEDVKLQMEAKLWAEIYNRHNPPKKIDMFQVSVLEFKNRPGSPLFHLEHFIEGKYIKYNSNSGFVDDTHIRFTPQAFSHFTFECSKHQLMVVDIQGVGDLYTDPQIHTANGQDYGDGNLGVKGFALFFSSHICNDVCKSLGLSQFDLAKSEFARHDKMVSSLKRSLSTQIRGCEEFVIGSPSSAGEYFRNRMRYRSDNSMCSDDNSIVEIEESEGYDSSSTSPSPLNLNNHHSHGIMSTIPSTSNQQNFSNAIPISSPISIYQQQQQQHQHQHQHAMHQHLMQRTPRVRNESSCLDSGFSIDDYFRNNNDKKKFKPRPSCVHAPSSDEDDDHDDEDDDEVYSKSQESDHDEQEEESILGKIHLELCKYHELGRFNENENDAFDQEAAFFHLKQAADLGIKEALTNIAKIYLQLPHDVLSSYQLEDNDANISIGFNYMLKNAEKKDKNSMFFIAKAYDTGNNLPKSMSTNWKMACDYYKKIDEMIEEEETDLEDSGYGGEMCSECDACYLILARIGEMYMQGGPGLDKDLNQACKYYTHAAERAIQFAKGRLANKYYMLAEQASSELEES